MKTFLKKLSNNPWSKLIFRSALLWAIFYNPAGMTTMQIVLASIFAGLIGINFLLDLVTNNNKFNNQ